MTIRKTMPFFLYEECLLSGKWPIDLSALDLWIRDFICRPHPLLIAAGRATAVCPLAEPALRQGSVWLSHLRFPNDPSIDRKDYAARHLLDLSANFKETFRATSLSLDCLIVTTEGLGYHEWRYVVDGAHQVVKPAVLRRQLMVGGFHPLNNRPSRLSPSLFPMQSPLPLFAMRHMIQSDWRTLFYDDNYMDAFRLFFRLRRGPKPQDHIVPLV